jgi:plastocyanin
LLDPFGYDADNYCSVKEITKSLFPRKEFKMNVAEKKAVEQQEYEINVPGTKRSASRRWPLSPFSKIAISGLLGVTVFGAGMWFTVGVDSFLMVGLITFVAALLVLTGIRWLPLLASLVGVLFLYVLLIVTPFPLYHLAHPTSAVTNPLLSFGLFVIIASILWCLVITVFAGIAAFIQNYAQRERIAPRWLTSVLAGAVGILVGGILIASLAPMSVVATADTGGAATVHLGISNFSQSSVNVAKGSSLKLIDDGAFGHNLVNGSWASGQPAPNRETGAPAVKNVAINGAGKSVAIGPFTTAGTYHIYCTNHTGMTLTIVVQ